MKASDDFKIDQAWWNKNKPTTLPSTGLGEVMKKYKDAQDTIARLVKVGSYTGEFATKVTPFEAAAAVLTKDIPAGVAKAKAKCNKTLHKDCIAVLDKCPKAVAAEMKALEQQETAFNVAYHQNHLGPLKTSATTLETQLTATVQKAQALVKQAEESTKIVLKRYAYLEKLLSAGTLAEIDIAQAKSDVKGDVAAVAKAAGEIAELLKGAEQAESAASKLDGAIKRTLSMSDQDDVRKKLNAVASLKNYVLEASKRAALLHTEVTSDKYEFKAKVSGKGLEPAKQIQLLTQLRDSTIGNEGAARKLENAFTNIILSLPKMTSAVKKAPNLDSIVIPPEVNIPTDRWVAQVQEWHTLAAAHLKKIEQMDKETTETKKKVYAQIDAAVGDQGEGKKLKDEIDAKHKGIGTYREKCDGDVQAFARALQTLTDEFKKRTR